MTAACGEECKNASTDAGVMPQPPVTPGILKNVTFDAITVGQSASITRTLGRDDIALFAAVSGDINPAHLDDAYATATPFKQVIGHGLWSGSLISAVLGTRLPGPGTIYLSQDLQFRRPVLPGDTVTATVTVLEKRPGRNNVVILNCRCTNQHGKDVVSGTAEVIAPTVAVRRQAMPLPTVQLIKPLA